MNKKLCIHLYALCWNEEVLLPHLFRYYSFVDKIFIYDNGSNDNSKTLIEAEPKAELINFDTSGGMNDEVQIQLKNSVWKKSKGIADFVIVIDTDEFIYNADLLAALQEMKGYGATILKPRGYQMISDETPDADQILTERITRGARSYQFDKCVLFDPNAITEINYTIGAHSCEPEGNVIYHRTPSWKLLHYKFLSFEYVNQRNHILAKRQSELNRSMGYSQHYLESEDDLRELMSSFQSRAETVVKSEPELEKETLSALYQQALAFLQQKEYAKAQNNLETVLAHSADNPDLLGNMSSALANQKLLDEAFYCQLQALSLKNDDEILWFNFANLRMRMDRELEAIQYYQYAIKINDKFWQAFLGLGRCHYGLGEKSLAIKQFQQVQKLRPQFVFSEDEKALLTQHELS
jgi:tetratricopeptide (TPR) repeat protein